MQSIDNAGYETNQQSCLHPLFYLRGAAECVNFEIMDAVINGVHIHVKKKNDHRLVYANGSLTSFEMEWNKGGYKWQFNTEDIPDILKLNEMDISNTIIMNERTRKT